MVPAPGHWGPSVPGALAPWNGGSQEAQYTTKARSTELGGASRREVFCGATQVLGLSSCSARFLRG